MVLNFRIGIPIIKDDGLDSEISGHFGRAKNFMIVNFKENFNQNKIVRDNEYRKT